jgi:CarboxypepD_reg-like domain
MTKSFTLFTLLLLSSLISFAQNRAITGSVKDNNGNPLPFASVVIAGTKTGTTTDESGKFTISAKNGATLYISAVNFKPREIAVLNSRANYEILLETSEKTMDELIVTAGGIKTKRKEFGTATTVIKNETLTAGKTLNVASGLQGKVAGLQINATNGGVNSNFRIILRGQRSLTGK